MVLILTVDQRYVPRVTKPPSYSPAVPVIHSTHSCSGSQTSEIESGENLGMKMWRGIDGTEPMTF